MNNKKLYSIHLFAATAILLYIICGFICILTWLCGMTWASKTPCIIFFLLLTPFTLSLLIFLTGHILMHKTGYSKKQRMLLYILCILGFALLSLPLLVLFAIERGGGIGG